jgi:hypothetical protein
MNILPIILGSVLAASSPQMLLQRQYPDAHLRNAVPAQSGYLVTGYTERKEEHNNEITNFHTPFVSMLDDQLEVRWTTHFQESRMGLGAIKAVAEHNGIVYAFGQQYVGIDGVAWLVRMDTEGHVLGDYSYYKEGFHTAEGIAVHPQQDGSIILIADLFLRYGSSGQPWIIKIDAQGKKLWDRPLGSAYSMALGMDITPTPDGGFVVAGAYYKDLAAMRIQRATAWLVKLDATGKQQWERSYPGGMGQMFGSIESDAEGNLIASLTVDGETKRECKMWVFDAQGNDPIELAAFGEIGFFVSDMMLSYGDGHVWLAGEMGKEVVTIVLDFRGQMVEQIVHGTAKGVDGRFGADGRILWLGRHQLLAVGG